MPNAGKSTLISVLSSARPKIADYPFTTLVPNLGVVRRPSGDGTLFADIPGLISGAASGAGLGHDFLRHIQRTRLLIHLLDAGSKDPLSDLLILEKELTDYGHHLMDRPRILALNKIELVKEEDYEELIKLFKDKTGKDLLLISAVIGKGLNQLLDKVWKELEI